MAAPKGNKFAEGHGYGRPSLYKEEYCEQLLEHMDGGLSFRSFAGVVRVNFDTVYEWAKRHKDFSVAKSQGEALEELFYEKIGRAGMSGKIKGFNASTYIFTRKNKSGWSDTADSSEGIQNINITFGDAENVED